MTDAVTGSCEAIAGGAVSTGKPRRKIDHLRGGIDNVRE